MTNAFASCCASLALVLSAGRTLQADPMPPAADSPLVDEPDSAAAGGQQPASPGDADQVRQDEPADDQWDNDFVELSLEQLMDIEVISVTRGEGQNIFTSPAAIHVITPEDIRRSGMPHLAELLRLAPGVHVARIDANKWAVAARGFNGRFNRLQLVQLDGRTLYTPTFSGVHWIAQDTVLEDIEQIEVIRGPGASLWGANAVNGVINIVTKPAADTQGFFLQTAVGSSEGAIATVRYGGRLGEDDYYRAYFKGQSHSGFDPTGYSDDWRRYQAGFRTDFALEDDDTLTIQGDFYHVEAGESVNTVDAAAGTMTGIPDDHLHEGANVLARWAHTAGDSRIQLQAYYDWTRWIVPYPGADFEQQLHLIDVDLQHSFPLAEAHQFIWGVNYRRLASDLAEGGNVAVTDTNIVRQSISSFVQDTITLVPDHLTLMLGTKLEYNELSHFEYQPSARLAYRINDEHAVWAAVSRAVRTPSLVERYGDITVAAAGPGMPVRVLHNQDFDSEELLAYELGYRTRVIEDVSIDVATFFNDFDRLQTVRDVTPLDMQFSNANSGESAGVEISATWRVADNWRLAGSYSHVTAWLHGVSESAEGDSAEHLATLQSFLDLTDQLEFNGALYYADNVRSNDIPAYTRLDLGVTWKPTPNVRLSVWGQNLLDEAHPEYGADGYLTLRSAEVERSILGELSIDF